MIADDCSSLSLKCASFLYQIRNDFVKAYPDKEKSLFSTWPLVKGRVYDAILNSKVAAIKDQLPYLCRAGKNGGTYYF